MPTHARRKSLTVLAAFLLVIAACGGDDDASDTTTAPTVADDGPVANACPAEGCMIVFVDVTPSGDELEITWEANFDPDTARNHIHVFWDTYVAEEVSADAEANGFTQGDWVPTDAFPTYVTESATSVANRGESTSLCVTAADRDHVVMDPSLVDCQDVSDLL